MPQYNSPTLGTATVVVAGDYLLFWKTALAGNQQITMQNLATSLQGLMTFSDTVSILTSNTTLDGTYQMVVGNSGAGFNLTLPAAVSYPGKRYRIVNKGAGAVTLLRTGGDTIAAGAGGAVTSLAIAQYYGYEVISDGVSMWYVMGK